MSRDQVQFDNLDWSSSPSHSVSRSLLQVVQRHKIFSNRSLSDQETPSSAPLSIYGEVSPGPGSLEDAFPPAVILLILGIIHNPLPCKGSECTGLQCSIRSYWILISQTIYHKLSKLLYNYTTLFIYLDQGLALQPVRQQLVFCCW